MIESFLALLALTSAPASADTTLRIPPGSVIFLIAESAELVVVAGSADRARLSGAGLGALRVSTKTEPGVMTIQLKGRARPGDTVRVELPPGNLLWITLASGSVEVSGRRTGTTINTLDAHIAASNIRGAYDAHTVSGRVSLTDARGQVQLRSTVSEVRVTGLIGSVTASSSSGALHLQQIDGAVTANTLYGAIHVDGAPNRGATWRVSSDLGNVELQLMTTAMPSLQLEMDRARVQAPFALQEAGGLLTAPGAPGGGRVVVEVVRGRLAMSHVRPPS